MRRTWPNASFVQSPHYRTQDVEALRRLKRSLHDEFDGLSLDLDDKQELVRDWRIPVQFPPTTRDPNRFVTLLAKRGLRLGTAMNTRYDGYNYVLLVPKTVPKTVAVHWARFFVLGVAAIAAMTAAVVSVF